jgi:L,D-transpeptidase catalytic domain
MMRIDSHADILMPSRRHFLGGAIAGVVACAIPSVASAMVENARLLTLAQRELARNQGQVWLRDRVGIVDFTLPSRDPRLFIVDMVAGAVKPFYVTHGRGSDPEHDGYLKSFSDVPDSLATSRGAFATRAYYEGKHGLSVRLQGLDADNHTAEARAIVIHGAWYANPVLIAEAGKLGRSEGCFALPEADLVEVVAKLGAGRLLFADRL